MAVGIVHIRPTGRIGCTVGHAGEFERFVVDVGNVARLIYDEDGHRRGYVVEGCDGKCSKERRGARRIEAVADQPVGWGDRAHGLLEGGQDICHGQSTGQLRTTLYVPEIGGRQIDVQVGLDKAGHQGLAGQVDDLGGIAFERHYHGRVPGCHDDSVADGQGGGLADRIDGQDVTADKDGICDCGGGCQDVTGAGVCGAAHQQATKRHENGG